MSESEWRDIASAPRDTTDVLLAYRRDDLGSIWPPIVIGYWSPSVNAWVMQGRGCRSYDAEPVGWLPLPAPPTPAAASSTPTGEPT